MEDVVENEKDFKFDDLKNKDVLTDNQSLNEDEFNSLLPKKHFDFFKNDPKSISEDLGYFDEGGNFKVNDADAFKNAIVNIWKDFANDGKLVEEDFDKLIKGDKKENLKEINSNSIASRITEKENADFMKSQKRYDDAQKEYGKAEEFYNKKAEALENMGEDEKAKKAREKADEVKSKKDESQELAKKKKAREEYRERNKADEKYLKDSLAQRFFFNPINYVINNHLLLTVFSSFFVFGIGIITYIFIATSKNKNTKKNTKKNKKLTKKNK